MPAKVGAIAVIDLGDFSRPDVEPLASKFAQRKLAGRPLVVRMARRLSECALVNEIFIVGSNVPEAMLTSEIAGVRSINLPSCHLAERLCAAADATAARWVVCVPANRPFVDPTMIDLLLAKAIKTKNCDYVGYASSSGDWHRMDHLGLAGEACHVDTLRRLRRNAERLPPDCGGCIASWLEHVPGAYHLKFIPVPSALDRDDLRFAIEDEADWDDAELLCETVAAEDCQWQQLAQVVISNSRLRKSMATRNS